MEGAEPARAQRSLGRHVGKGWKSKNDREVQLEGTRVTHESGSDGSAEIA